jgi:defect-in-organelle-trafficking protein DotD
MVTNQHMRAIMRLPSTNLLLLGCLALLAGCSSQSTVKPVATEPDIVTVKLAQAADKASQALDSIAGIEQQRGPTPVADDYDHAPANLMQPITLRWSGPIEQVTETLASRAGLRFRVKGNQPAVPVTVNIDVYQQPILHVLKNIGLQAGHRADLIVDATGGAVEVRYAPADKSQ